MPPAETPRILWVELTSRCPFDCIFCSRKTRRGGGQHMPWELFQSLVRQVRAPRKFLLNYSGESTVYPHLVPAIRLARSTGAAVELVSALASAPDTLVRELVAAGLTRLTVSLHAASEDAFHRIYRHASFAALESRLELLAALRDTVPDPPEIDLAFVGMHGNLDQLEGVARIAGRLRLSAIGIFPIIRRDQTAIPFPAELDAAGHPRPEFQAELNRHVDECRRRHPALRFLVSNPRFTAGSPGLGACPRPCPGELPAQARIHSCEQNPWETAHVLSNGDVVPCEVHDRTPLGSLAAQSLAAIWHGEPYARFRVLYQAGEVAACRSCPWKTAYLPGPLAPEILAGRGPSAQMAWGWHDPDGERHIWASQQAVATLAPRAHSRHLHVRGILPPGPPSLPNSLAVACNGAPAGTVENPTSESLSFDADLPVATDPQAVWNIEFQTRFVYRPRERGASSDGRDLGFALLSLSAHEQIDAALVSRQRSRVRRLFDTLAAIDRLGRALRPRFPTRTAAAPPALRPGLSVIIPERNNVPELALCLAGLRAAAERCPHPVETLVVVNGAAPHPYRELQRLHPGVCWQFHPRPLGFARAVSRGLAAIRHEWVYLLNSDMVLDPTALETALSHRRPDVFSIASQILLKDPTRFRDETNWTRLFIHEGLAATHDLVPRSSATIEHFYAGGGASLFQTRLLRRVLDETVYHPFYWEDVEWGWRARKLGYRSLFCGSSLAHHTHRATISRHYPAAEIENVIARNRLLFQLRNFLTVGSVEAVADAVARAVPEVAGYFSTWRAWCDVARGRLWNHRAPASDEAVLALRYD